MSDLNKLIVCKLIEWEKAANSYLSGEKQQIVYQLRAWISELTY